MYTDAIIFDFNGTMFFDVEFQEKAWKNYLEGKIGRRVTNEEFHEYVHGRNAENTFRYFLGREVERKEVAALEEEKEVVYRQLCLDNPDKFKLAPGLPSFLDELKEKKIPMTIATASAENNVRFFFEHLELDKWFDFQKVVFNDGSIKGKPEPDIFLTAADKLGVDMEKCTVFEDTISGLKAAYRAKAARIVAVTSMLDEATVDSLEGISHKIRDYCDKEDILKKI